MQSRKSLSRDRPSKAKLLGIGRRAASRLSLFERAADRLRYGVYATLDELPPIWLSAHHKSGTVLLRSTVVRAVRPYGYSLVRVSSDHEIYRHLGPYDGTNLDGDTLEDRVIYLDCHSACRPQLTPPAKRVHIVRDPRAMITSAVRYHRWSHEPWLHVPRAELGGRSYQEMIRASSNTDALLSELENLSSTFAVMRDWQADPLSLELRYEDLVGAQRESSVKTLLAWLLPGINVERAATEVMRMHRRAPRIDRHKPLNLRHFGNNLGDRPSWTLTAERELKSRFGDMLERYGYQQFVPTPGEG